MSQNTHPFLRIEIFKFQLGHSKQNIDLTKIKTEVHIKEKHDSTKPRMLIQYLY